MIMAHTSDMILVFHLCDILPQTHKSSLIMRERERNNNNKIEGLLTKYLASIPQNHQNHEK